MGRRFAALALLAALLAATQSAAALSTMCAEPSFAAAQEPQAFVPLPLRDDELPWCASPEDPRCAPLHGDSGSLPLGLREPTVIAAEPAAIAGARSGDQSFSPTTGGNPHAGVHSRVERPPRADW